MEDGFQSERVFASYVSARLDYDLGHRLPLPR